MQHRILVVCMCAIDEYYKMPKTTNVVGRGYLYNHPRRGTDKTKTHPFDAVQVNGAGREEAIKELMSSYGLTDYTVLTPDDARIQVVRVNRDYPRKGNEVIKVEEFGQVLNNFQDFDTIPNGIDDIEEVRGIIASQLPKKKVAA